MAHHKKRIDQIDSTDGKNACLLSVSLPTKKRLLAAARAIELASLPNLNSTQELQGGP